MTYTGPTSNSSSSLQNSLDYTVILDENNATMENDYNTLGNSSSTEAEDSAAMANLNTLASELLPYSSTISTTLTSTATLIDPYSSLSAMQSAYSQLSSEAASNSSFEPILTNVNTYLQSITVSVNAGGLLTISGDVSPLELNGQAVTLYNLVSNSSFSTEGCTLGNTMLDTPQSSAILMSGNASLTLFGKSASLPMYLVPSSASNAAGKSLASFLATFI